MRTMFVSPNSLDEVQMLQSLGDSAFARYLLGCFWYSKRRYDEAVSCWRETLEKSPDYAPALIVCWAFTRGINSRMQRRRWLICSAP